MEIEQKPVKNRDGNVNIEVKENNKDNYHLNVDAENLSNKNEKFTYTYNAPNEDDRKKIEEIRKQYLPEGKSETKFQQLKQLHFKTTKFPKIIASLLGISGTLIFGGGLSFVLEFNEWAVGCVLMLIGGVILALSYPVYNRIFKMNKKKYGEQILKLSEELLKDEKQ